MKFVTILLSLLASALLFACSQPQASTVPVVTDTAYVIEVPSMVCQSCVGTLSAAFAGIPGVGEVSCEMPIKTFTIAVDSKQVPSQDTLVEAIQKSGYKVGQVSVKK
jgi:copper chaperone CopZ